MPRMSDDAIQAKTRRTWEQWFTLLDADGAKDWDHAHIARHVADRHGVAGWYAQAVTVEYEKARGKRVTNENCDGEAYASASKTVSVPIEALYAAVTDDVTRAAWLPDGGLTPRKATAPKSARFDWQDGSSRVNFNFWDKGPGKAQVSLEHEKLADVAEAERMKAFWRDRLAALKAHLEA